MIGQYALVERGAEVDRWGSRVRRGCSAAIHSGGCSQKYSMDATASAEAVHVELLNQRHRGREQQVSRRGLAIVEHACPIPCAPS